MTRLFNSALSRQQFLETYWQKRPLLMRGAFPDFSSPVTPQQLAGLACEEGVESRIVETRGHQGGWQVSHGPFDEQDFSRLPSSHWTLLVQDMDKHVPALADLMARFDFIPDWRRDDVMVSYAVEQGSVGPHTDGYDVFLLQAAGTRRWQIGERPLMSPRLLEGQALRVLAEFEPAHSWDLQPGDMLYLPPHIAHHGIALTECMTFSIGFRAPSQVELLDALVDNLLDLERGEQRYGDADLRVPEYGGEIDAQALRRFQQLLVDTLAQSADIVGLAAGRVLTQTKPGLAWLGDQRRSASCSAGELGDRFESGDRLLRNPCLRLAWLEGEQNMTLFCAGEAYTLDSGTKAWMPALTSGQRLDVTDWHSLRQLPQLVTLLLTLIEEGAWYWAGDFSDGADV